MQQNSIYFLISINTTEFKNEFNNQQSRLSGEGVSFNGNPVQAGDGKEICAGVGSPYTEAGLLDAEKKLAALPANLQVQVGKLPDKARNALIRYPL